MADSELPAQVKALAAIEADEGDNSRLPFERGDIIDILGEENGFYIGELGGRTGKIPKAFVKPYDEAREALEELIADEEDEELSQEDSEPEEQRDNRYGIHTQKVIALNQRRQQLEESSDEEEDMLLNEGPVLSSPRLLVEVKKKMQSSMGLAIRSETESQLKSENLSLDDHSSDWDTPTTPDDANNQPPFENSSNITPLRTVKPDISTNNDGNVDLLNIDSPLGFKKGQVKKIKRKVKVKKKLVKSVYSSKPNANDDDDDDDLKWKPSGAGVRTNSKRKSLEIRKKVHSNSKASSTTAADIADFDPKLVEVIRKVVRAEMEEEYRNSFSGYPSLQRGSSELNSTPNTSQRRFFSTSGRSLSTSRMSVGHSSSDSRTSSRWPVTTALRSFWAIIMIFGTLHFSIF